MTITSAPETAFLDAERLESAIQVARRASRHADGSLWTALLACLEAPPHIVVASLQRWHGVAIVDPSQSHELRVVDDATAEAEGAIALTLGTEKLLVFEDPWSSQALQLLAKRNDGRTRLALALPGQFRDAYSLRSRATRVTSSTEMPTTSLALDASPIVQFVDAAILKAYDEGASDVHFETDRRGIAVKFRFDGVMVSGERLANPSGAAEVISRIKVLAQLDITEHRRPQDGRIHWQIPSPASLAEETIDLRVSIMPSIFGEDAVLRLLDKAQLRHTGQTISLDALGFDHAVRSTIRDLAARPHGMLLVTGPTGSGKTTTVYATLAEVNDGLEKVITIEDPVEYELPGVLQIPVNEQKGLTFATGLRSILRHDPDKILVGEIRDAETAEVAIQSSLTGHLVFTTVHANSVFDVLGRFQHFGIDPFALASALNGIVVQRLLRRLCPSCPTWRMPTEAEMARVAKLGIDLPNKLPSAGGCEKCRGTGYRGRFVVAEVHTLTDEVRDLIVEKATMTQLKTTLYGDGDRRLLVQSIGQVANGQTTLEEVGRVVGLV